MSDTITKPEKRARAPARSSSSRAKLLFPVGMIKTKLKSDRAAANISISAAIALAAVLEYVTSEVLSVTHETLADKTKRLTSRHIYLSTINDSELSELINKASFKHSGVMPKIHSVLIPKKKQTSKQPDATTTEPAK